MTGGSTVKAIIKYTKSCQGEFRGNLSELFYALSTELGTVTRWSVAALEKGVGFFCADTGHRTGNGW